jgi:hypothetical protein
LKFARGSRQNTHVPKRKVAFEIEDELVRATNVHAERTGKVDSEIVEEALRRHLAGDPVVISADAPNDEALSLAYRELRAYRRQGRRRVGP